MQCRQCLCTLLLGLFPVVAVAQGVGPLMERVFSYAGRTGFAADDYAANVYVQFDWHTQRRNALLRLVPGFSRVPRGELRHFGESALRVQSRPDGTDVRELAYFSTMPHPSGSELRTMRRFTPTLYAATLFNDRLLSPLHRRNRSYYVYAVDSLFRAVDGAVCARVSFRPRFRSTHLVSGSVVIDTLSGAVCRFDLACYYDMSHLRFSGTMGREGKASLLPGELLVTSRSRLLGNTVTARYATSAAYDFSTSASAASPVRRRRDLTSLYQLRVDTTGVRRDRAYFDSLRTMPLPPLGEQLYAAAATSVHPSLPDSASAAATAASAAVEDFFLNRRLVSLGQGGELRFPAIVTPEMFTWSRAKGVVLQTRARLSYAFSPLCVLRFVPKVGYSFRQRRLYWRTPLTLAMMPALDGRLDLEAGRGNRAYSSTQADAVRRTLRGVTNYDTLTAMLNAAELRFYDDVYAQTAFSLSPAAGLRLSAGVRYHYRTLVGWGSDSREAGMERTVSSFAPRFHVDWTPGQYYYWQGRRRVPVRSAWPTFRFDYERAVRLGRAHSEYERFELDVQHTIPLYALRSLYVRGGFGCFTDRGGSYFLDYDNFRDDHLQDLWQDEMSGKFYALSPRWYNESDYYVRLSLAYESPLLLLCRLRPLSSLLEKERLYCNTASLRALHPYTELGYGVSTQMADASAFLGLARGMAPTVGFKLVFHWFDNW